MGFADISHIAFPWDLLTGFAAHARAHRDGLIDLSVGTPIDDTPEIIQQALAQAANAPGYPATAGSVDLRQAVVEWFARRRQVPGLDPRGVMPTVGSKEFVGLVASLLGLGPGDVVVHPDVAYPTYDVGARLAGATPFAASDVDQWRHNPRVRLVWVNSPGNPHGRVASISELRDVVHAARALGAVVMSDECYAELAWSPELRDGGVPSLLDPRVTDGDLSNLLVTYSLSKQSSIAGYRAAFVAGDVSVVQRLIATRKHLGMIVPAPVQHAMAVALRDDTHVADQRARYGRRRALMRPVLESAGVELSHSEAGLYLWGSASRALGTLSDEATRLTVTARGELPGECWDVVGYFADRGILVAPGAFYGRAGADHVRIALTSSDSSIDQFITRLS